MFSVVPTTRNSSTTHRSRRTTREKWTVTWFWSCAVACLTVVVVRSRGILNSLMLGAWGLWLHWWQGKLHLLYVPLLNISEEIILSEYCINTSFQTSFRISNQDSYFNMYDPKQKSIFSAGSRPWDKGGGGGRPVTQTLRQEGSTTGGAWSPQNCFGPFRSQFGLKIRGAHPGPLPWICHWS